MDIRRSDKDPTDEKNIVKLSHKKFAPESKKKMKWAVNMYCEWRVNHMQKIKVPIEIVRANLDDLYNVTQNDLCYSLSCFIAEVKKVDGSDFPPNFLKEIIVMIQMFLNEKGVYWKLLDGQLVNFQKLCNVIDNLMKEKTVLGLGTHVSSSIILLAQEDKLFFDGILGEETPIKLIKTMVYMMGMHLVLRGGVEHTRLRHPGFNCQISVNVDDKGRKQLIYKENHLTRHFREGWVLDVVL